MIATRNNRGKKKKSENKNFRINTLFVILIFLSLVILILRIYNTTICFTRTIKLIGIFWIDRDCKVGGIDGTIPPFRVLLSANGSLT